MLLQIRAVEGVYYQFSLQEKRSLNIQACYPWTFPDFKNFLDLLNSPSKQFVDYYNYREHRISYEEHAIYKEHYKFFSTFQRKQPIREDNNQQVRFIGQYQDDATSRLLYRDLKKYIIQEGSDLLSENFIFNLNHLFGMSIREENGDTPPIIMFQISGTSDCCNPLIKNDLDDSEEKPDYSIRFSSHNLFLAFLGEKAKNEFRHLQRTLKDHLMLPTQQEW